MRVRRPSRPAASPTATASSRPKRAGSSSPAGAEFEEFVRELSRPAEADGLPPRLGPPTAEQVEQLAGVAAEHGIAIVGPPL